MMFYSTQAIDARVLPAHHRNRKDSSQMKTLQQGKAI